MSRRWITRAVADSLRRPATDWIDLYQIHRLGPEADIEETLGALTDLAQQGEGPLHRRRDRPGPGDRRAQWAARDRHLQRFVTEQPPYSILVRGVETNVLPTCAKYGMGVMTYSLLTGG
jgi:aryl-alcohol dehydrogenase-like predicted oxidoreductase